MSRAAPPTADQLTAAFEDLLTHPAGDVPTDTGLDDDTTIAIERVWAAGTKPSEALVSAARHEFALQLDGTHVREAAAREDAIFTEVAAQYRPQP